MKFKGFANALIDYLQHDSVLDRASFKFGLPVILRTVTPIWSSPISKLLEPYLTILNHVQTNICTIPISTRFGQERDDDIIWP